FKGSLDTGYNRMIQEASGQYVEGDTEQTKEFIGIAIDDPSIPNQREYDLDEKEYIELHAKLQAFNSRQEITKITVTCGTEQEQWEIVPKAPYQGIRYVAEELTCYGPGQSIQLGLNKVAFRALAEGFVTEAHLTNNFVHKDALDGKLRDWAIQHSATINNPSDHARAISDEFGVAGDTSYLSVSDQGPLKLIIQTEPTSVIGIDESHGVRLKVALENAAPGTITFLHTLTVQLPEGLHIDTDAESCPHFTQDRTTVTVDPSYLGRINLDDVAKNQQVAIGSCMLTTDKAGLHALLKFPAMPNPVIFAASVTYDYLAVKEYSVMLRSPYEESAANGYDDLGDGDASVYSGSDSDSWWGDGWWSGDAPATYDTRVTGKCADVINYAQGYLGTGYGGLTACSAKNAQAGACTTQCGSFVSNAYRYTGHAVPVGNGDGKCDGPLVTKIGKDPSILQPGDIFSYSSRKSGHTGMFVGVGYQALVDGHYVFKQDPNGKPVFIHSTNGCYADGTHCSEVQYIYYDRLVRYHPNMVFCRHKECT
ncbi:hypothetical protein COY28_03790, partial [Candidatus Woesearchaeota archaeon CG_4_10_14_0_2_um_filter_57_5]